MATVPGLNVRDLLERRDTANAREHTEQSQLALRTSIDTFGAGRSILLDAAGVVRAGNGTVTAAAAAGINDLLIVPSDGTELIAVRRSDLSADQLAAMALADNRTGELSKWGPLLGQVARHCSESGFNIESLGFDPDEMRYLLKRLEPKPDAPPSDDETVAGPEKKPHIESTAPDQSGKLKRDYQILVFCDTLAERSELLEWCESENLEAEPLKA